LKDVTVNFKPSGQPVCNTSYPQQAYGLILNNTDNIYSFNAHPFNSGVRNLTVTNWEYTVGSSYNNWGFNVTGVLAKGSVRHTTITCSKFNELRTGLLVEGNLVRNITSS